MEPIILRKKHTVDKCEMQCTPWSQAKSGPREQNLPFLTHQIIRFRDADDMQTPVNMIWYNDVYLAAFHQGLLYFLTCKAHCVDRITVKKYLFKCWMLQSWVVLPIDRRAC